MIEAVEEFFERFLTLTLEYLRLKTTPRGGYVLEKFLIKKDIRPENAYLSIEFSKNETRFLEKTKSPRELSPNFFYPGR